MAAWARAFARRRLAVVWSSWATSTFGGDASKGRNVAAPRGDEATAVRLPSVSTVEGMRLRKDA